MDEIKNWLENPDSSFDDGYHLYMKHGRNRNIMSYLGRKHDMVKLRYELGKFVPSQVKEVVASTLAIEALEKPDERLRIVREGGVTYEQLPDELKPVFKSAVECYREMRSLHEKLKLEQTDEARAQAREQLLKLDDERRTHWGIIDKWAETGELPTADETQADYKSVAAARAAVTRNVKTLETETDTEKVIELVEKTRKAVEIITAAGGKFDKLLEPLKRHGILKED